MARCPKIQKFHLNMQSIYWFCQKACIKALGKQLRLQKNLKISHWKFAMHLVYVSEQSKFCIFYQRVPILTKEALGKWKCMSLSFLPPSPKVQGDGGSVLTSSKGLAQSSAVFEELGYHLCLRWPQLRALEKLGWCLIHLCLWLAAQSLPVTVSTDGVAALVGAARAATGNTLPWGLCFVLSPFPWPIS